MERQREGENKSPSLHPSVSPSLRPPLFVSYFTAGTPYEQEAAALEKTLDAFGLEREVEARPDLGAWVKNCGQKARFILDKMTQRPGRALVWLDADARVRKAPDVFRQLHADFAAHWLGGAELLSGTLYFAPTAAARRLVARWRFACETNPGEWDQRVLAGCLPDAVAAGLTVAHLPPEYTWIAAPGNSDDISRQKYGNLDPVIVHEQASRRHRV